jgi:hypothetical protein
MNLGYVNSHTENKKYFMQRKINLTKEILNTAECSQFKNIWTKNKTNLIPKKICKQCL